MATGLAERLGFMYQTVLGFMGLDWQFRAAVKIGDTIRVQATVSELKPMPRLGGGYVTFRVQILNQEDKVVQRGEWTVLVKSKEG
jgi:acyl dehydratase